ncbi:MAG: hypothetical protein ABEH83_00705 [Halobacterium sp.]
MTWYAVDALEDALAESEALLLPFDLGTWLRLAVVTVFAGTAPPQTPAVSVDVTPQTAVGFVERLSDPAFVAAIATVVAGLVALGVVFAALGSVMEFVLVDVLRSRRVRVLAPFRDRVGAGLRLFAFRLVVGALLLLAAAGVVVPIALAVLSRTPLPLVALLVTVPLFLAAAALAALVLEFTTAFVVPLVADHGGGVLDGWRRLYPTLRAEWREFGVYVLVKAVVLVGAGLVLGLAGAMFAVPVGVFALAGAVTPLALVVSGVAALVGLAVVAAVSVPTVTFLRYHSLATLSASGAPFTLRGEESAPSERRE